MFFGIIYIVNTPKSKIKALILPFYQFLNKTQNITPELNLQLSPSTITKLNIIREDAFESGVFTTGKNKYFDAKIGFDTASYNVLLRLKGDYLDHLSEDKWSFRVKSESPILNMTTFSLQHPNTRNFIYEWIFHKTIKKHGICGLNYDFVSLTTNNINKGVYAVEEHFNQHLLAKNKLTPSPILKFDETEHWNKYKLAKEKNPTIKEYHVKGSFIKAKINAFHQKKNKIWTDSLYNKSISLLSKFRNQELSTSDVFNIEKLAIFYALTDFSGSQHAVSWRNFRFYYNSTIDKLEPIPFDGNSGSKISDINILNKNELNTLVFNDTSFIHLYKQKLAEFSTPYYLENLLKDLTPEMTLKMSIINSEFPFFKFDKAVFIHNQTVIKEYLESTPL
jgi:hypothetical protein